MSRSTRIFVAIVAGLAVLSTASFAFAAAAVYRAGSLALEVHEAGPNGTDLSLRVPAVFVDLAARWLPAEACRNLPEEWRRYGPAIREAALELAASPDCVFLEIDSPGESVRLAMEDGTLVVNVVSDGDSVRVGVPARTAANVLARFGRACSS